jgi:FXSXX-COOH protein
VDEQVQSVVVGGPAWAPLIDVSGLPLAALNSSSETALAQAIRRVLVSLDDPNGVISAFESFASIE